jgi:16S rRNA (guanine527-N7)-methyltransferase
MSADSLDEAVLAWLAEAQRRGFTGPGPVASLVEHSQGFADAVVSVLGRVPVDAVDLGSGGGLPGLVLAARWPAADLTLVEGSRRRADFLEQAARDLGRHRAGGLRVVGHRAEELGRDPDWREKSEIVLARSFGPPPVTAECAAPLVRVGGWLVVSEPPDVEVAWGELAWGESAWAAEDGAAHGPVARWPSTLLGPLGLAPQGVIRTRGYGYQALQKVHASDPRYPRRVGIPAKRPLY